MSFTDDNFLGFDSRFHGRAIQIARHIHTLNPALTFEIVCRVDAVELEPFQELASLGMVGVYLGIESGVQRVLDTFRKQTTIDQNLQALRVLSASGVGCDVGFITFSPGMTIPEVKQSLEFLRRILDEYPIFVHPAAVFRCLREYPKDLGEAALVEPAAATMSQLSSPIRGLYEALDAIWHEEFEAEFIRYEGLAATCGDDGTLLDRQMAMTEKMLQRAFALLKEIETHADITAADLLAAGVSKDRCTTR